MIEIFRHLFPPSFENFKWIFDHYQTSIYFILFLIIFIETGLVIMPFLPGDSLLFTAGLFARLGFLDLGQLIAFLFIAAVLGDNLNYVFGRNIGLRVLHIRFRGKTIVKQEYLDKTHAFYEKHGPKAIILARFVPIVRTFAPFVAGIAEMKYRTFILFDLLGGILWIASLTLTGYLFGHIEWIQKHIEMVCIGIIFLSIVPMLLGMFRAKKTN
ncbi:MAG TPA: VTT domain-containing protein [Bacteroidia bacterium]|jgi:membrane-associated protein|nr:VTT domain-containing protein [Bacteroidia bacterium]